MVNLVHADLFKLRKSLFIKITFGVSVLAAAGFGIASYLFAKGTIALNSVGLASFLADLQMISLLGNLSAAFLVCGDFDNKAIHNAVASGSGRHTVILSKYAVLVCVVAVLLFPYLLVSIVGGALDAGFAQFIPSTFLGLMERTAPLTAVVAFRMVGIGAVNLLVYASQLSLVFLLAFMIRKPIVVVVVGYAFFFATGQMMALDNKVSEIMGYTPFGTDWTTLTVDAGASAFVKPVVVSVVFLAAMLLATWLVFRKSEVK